MIESNKSTIAFVFNCFYHQGEKIEMSTSDGTFDSSRLDLCQTLILIAAGTGLTPMMRILDSIFHHDINPTNRTIVLLFFNQTQDDILCRQDLQKFAIENK
jgi:cytochrome-b5 reductase